MMWYSVRPVWKVPWRAMTGIRVEWPLRLGCGCVNLYAGFFLLTDPSRFYKYVPEWLSHAAHAVASVDAYLRLQGIGELMIAISLLGWCVPRWCVRAASMLLAVEMSLILLFVGVDSVTFRNIGLLGGALTLLLLSYQDVTRQDAPPHAQICEGIRRRRRLSRLLVGVSEDSL